MSTARMSLEDLRGATIVGSGNVGTQRRDGHEMEAPSAEPAGMTTASRGTFGAATAAGISSREAAEGVHALEESARSGGHPGITHESRNLQTAGLNGHKDIQHGESPASQAAGTAKKPDKSREI